MQLSFSALPSWATSLRPQQETAIANVLAAFRSSPVVFLEAPTGSGKTLIADIVRQHLAPRALYVCHSLSLQEQFRKDFPTAALIKGRSNYPTHNHPLRFRSGPAHLQLSCEDCNRSKFNDGWRCAWCDPVADCPYEIAKYDALLSPVVCANSLYLLYELNFGGILRNRDLVVIDEVDTLESVLMSFIKVSITESRMREFGLPYPDKKTVMASWCDWAQECSEIVGRARFDEQGNLFDPSPDLRKLRAQKRHLSFARELGRLLDPLTGLMSGNWVYDGYRDNDVIFKPISVAPYAHDYLWRYGRQWLLMSATIISAEEMAASLGLVPSSL